MDYDDLFNILNECKQITIKGKLTKERIGTLLEPTFELYNTPWRSLVNDSKQYHYLIHELVWYLNGNRSTEYIAKYAPFWNSIRDESGNVNSNYGYQTIYDKCHILDGERISPIQWCVKALANDLYTRQAVMMYNKPKYVGYTKDFICTQTQQFLYRDNRLHSIVYIRSSDLIRGLSFDIPWWRLITDIVSNSIYCTPGEIKIFIGSSHVYSEHFDLVKKMSWKTWDKYNITTKLKLNDIYAENKRWTYDKVRNSVMIHEQVNNR